MIAALFSLLACTTLPTTPQEDWRVSRMDLELSFLPEDGVFLVEGELALTNVSDGELAHVDLLVRDPFREELQLFGTELGAVELAKDDDFEDSFVARGSFREPVPAGAERRIGFTFAGELHDNQFEVTPTFACGSWVERWYPIPLWRDRARPESNPLAAGRTVMHLPASWHGVTNGELVGREEGELEATETWEVERAVARSFAAGPYVFEELVVGERRVGVYQLSTAASSPRESAATLAAALEAMEARYGPYPFPSFRIAEAPMHLGNWGASSEQGFLLVKPNFLMTPGGNLALFAHEAAHGWWGNLVGQRGPGSILCSESLAQYGAVVAIETLEGPEAAAEFLRFSRRDYIPDQCARGYFRGVERGQDMPLAEMEGGGWQHHLADAKGHWVFHMLRQRVGDELFFGTLRGILETYAGEQLSLDELRAAFLERAPAEADLERFFAQWLDRAGAPRLEVEWTATDGGTEVTLRQVQAGEPFALRVELELIDESGDPRRVEMRIEEREAHASFDGPPPAEVRVDPDHRLLLWSPEYL
jgi:hypothetical protein